MNGNKVTCVREQKKWMSVHTEAGRDELVSLGVANHAEHPLGTVGLKYYNTQDRHHCVPTSIRGWLNQQSTVSHCVVLLLLLLSYIVQVDTWFLCALQMVCM